MRELPCDTLGEETGRSSAWSERRVWDAEVAGSDPAAPTRTDRMRVVAKFCGECVYAQAGLIAHPSSRSAARWNWARSSTYGSA